MKTIGTKVSSNRTSSKAKESILTIVILDTSMRETSREGYLHVIFILFSISKRIQSFIGNHDWDLSSAAKSIDLYLHYN